MCKKIKHKTTYQACRHILALKKKKGDKPYGISYCDECGHYHVSSKYKNSEYIVDIIKK